MHHNVVYIIAENRDVSVFNFYNYLRTHPLLLRQKLASQADKEGRKAAAMLSGFSHAAKESDKVTSNLISFQPFIPIFKGIISISWIL